MKMIILAGGQRSTISEETESIPKPMLQIGGRPLLWHIMKHASLCGVNEFVVCGGYKIEMIKDYFLDFYIYQSDIRVDTGNNKVEILDKNTEDWKIEIVDTGLKTMPVDRIKRVLDIAGDKFFISYGDCLSDISLEHMTKVHEAGCKDFTVAVARPAGRKMPLHFTEGNDDEFRRSTDAWASAGVFIATKAAFSSITNENDIEEMLTSDNSSVYRHEGFFNTIETLRDKAAAEEMWNKSAAPWMGVI